MDQEQQQEMNSGLTRYRSAPSSYFVNLISSGTTSYEGEQFFNTRATSPDSDSDRFFSRFMSTCGAGESNPIGDIGGGGGRDCLVNEPPLVEAVTAMKHEPEELLNVPTNSNLLRHSSSPAGMFANINVVHNGYGVMRGMGNFGATTHGTSAEASFSPTSRLKNQSDYPPRPPMSSGMMTHTAGIGSPESATFVESHRNDAGYMTGGFPTSSWDDSALLSDNYLKGFAENQSDEGGDRAPAVLAHHLSLPTSSAEMSAMDKLLQFQDSVPLKIRAKRGCATHPRSIAERVRRTRISERMRKLQELVPNMDKQTNTADMLDLAVDYIKDLQKQVKTLSDARAKCTCSSSQKS